jgi:hypothetical protein
MIRTTVDRVTAMCVFTHLSGGNLVEVVCSIDSTSSYCTAGQITDRYFSLSQLIYTSGLKNRAKRMKTSQSWFVLLASLWTTNT